MDAQMPILSGYDATRQIRSLSDEKLSKIPIIALTASVMRADLERCIDAGMNGYIPKPFKKHELISGIAESLNIKLKLNKLIPKDEFKIKSITQNTDVSNLDYLEEFCSGDKEKMKKYIGLFLKSAPKFISDLEEYVGNNNEEDIANLVHGFNTKFTMMGMKDSRSKSIIIENVLRDEGSISQVKDELEGLLNEAKTGIEELTNSINSL